MYKIKMNDMLSVSSYETEELANITADYLKRIFPDLIITVLKND